MSQRPELGVQSSGPGNGKEHDHDRRLRLLEKNEVQVRSDLTTIRLAHENLRKDLFGDPDRRDEGGEGAFARLEHVVKGEGERRLMRATRIWQIATGVLISVVVAGATFLFTLVPHK